MNRTLRDILDELGCERVRLVIQGDEENILYDSTECTTVGVPDYLLDLIVINIKADTSPDDFIIVLENKEDNTNEHGNRH